MMYNYQSEREQLFTEAGQRMFLRIRDNVQKLLSTAGAVRMQEAIRNNAGDSWEMLACVDRMVELGELVEIKQSGCAGQHRIFVNANLSARTAKP